MKRMDDGAAEFLRAFRRDLHRHPELRFQEDRTAGKVAEALRQAGVEVETGIAETGVVGRMHFAEPGPHVLVRADMDALPTADLKTVEYASRNPGVAHACGHDVHTSVVLGVARALAEQPPQRGSLTLVFQPAEEIPFGQASGGAAMLETGVLEDVDVVLGLHCWPSLPAGTIGVDASIAMASKRAFKISVRGTGAHAATPSKGRDAVLAASSIVVGLNQLLGREMDPGARVALNVGTIVGGNSQSIVAPTAELTGTIRAVDSALADRLRDAVERVAAGVADAAGVAAVVEWKNEMPPVRNHTELVDRAMSVLGAHPDLDAVLLDQPPMTADDFALYALARPGLYVKLGVCAPDGSLGCNPLHDGRFDIDESAIDSGVLAVASLVEDFLERGLEEQA